MDKDKRNKAVALRFLWEARSSLAGGQKLHALHSAERAVTLDSLEHLIQTPCSELNGRTASEVCAILQPTD